MRRTPRWRNLGKAVAIHDLGNPALIDSAEAGRNLSLIHIRAFPEKLDLCGQFRGERWTLATHELRPFQRLPLKRSLGRGNALVV